MKAIKIFYIVIFGLLAIFLLQNIALVTVSFLFWEITLPRSVVLAITFGLGGLAGIGFTQLRDHRKGVK